MLRTSTLPGGRLRPTKRENDQQRTRSCDIIAAPSSSGRPSTRHRTVLSLQSDRSSASRVTAGTHATPYPARNNRRIPVTKGSHQV
jgi:hypothetical protein